MSGLSEDVIRQITERVTREVLAALTPQDVVVDEWPDYDEYASIEPEPSVAEVETQPSPEPEPREPSMLRQAARGNVVIGVTEDGDEIRPDASGMRGPVVPIGFSEPVVSSGFDPRSNPEWFARERAKDLAQRRQPAWETQVKAI